jgi:S-adenosylmethionine:tRNA ribosyltransferase-isomerase
LLTIDLDLTVPEGLIAQRPVEPRDACRLMTLDCGSGAIGHRVFRDLPGLLRPGDVLVVNDSKVFPARLHVRKSTGGAVELLFLRPVQPAGEVGEEGRSLDAGGPSVGAAPERWEALARPSRRLRSGMTLMTAGGDELLLHAPLDGGRWLVDAAGDRSVLSLLEAQGQLPLPPYIHAPLSDTRDYQTVFARPVGSAAAPTAGLHLTAGLMADLRAKGVAVVPVTLHIGLDTFRPVSTERVEDHPIHREPYALTSDARACLDTARAEGRRLVAVGTTVVRVLETLYQASAPAGAAVGASEGWCDLFITPGYRFVAVDALVTNFHLPRTSLLALVMAFAGVERIREAYAEAVGRRYRFFSFGDAMLIEGACGGRRAAA